MIWKKNIQKKVSWVIRSLTHCEIKSIVNKICLIGRDIKAGSKYPFECLIKIRLGKDVCENKTYT